MTSDGRDRRHPTARQHEMGVGWQMGDEVAKQRGRRRPRADLVDVVDDQAHVDGRHLGEGLDHALGRGEAAVGTAERGGDRLGERVGVTVARFARHPDVDAARGGVVGPDRLRQGRGLAEPRPGEHGHQGDVETATQLFDQSGPDQLRRQSARWRRTPTSARDRIDRLGHAERRPATTRSCRSTWCSSTAVAGSGSMARARSAPRSAVTDAATAS